MGRQRLWISVIMLGGLAIGGGYAGARLGMPETLAQPARQHETAYDRIMRTRVIRCGYFVWPPFLVKDANTGALSGFSHDFMAALGAALDVKIEWTQELGFASYLQDLASGRYDMECTGGWPNAKRGQLAFFSKPYAFMPSVAVARANDARFDKSLDAINAPTVTVATIDGEASAMIRDSRFPATKQASLPDIASPSDLILNVVTGKADVTFLDLVSVRQYDARYPGKIKILGLDHPVHLIALSATLPQDERLKQMIDTATDQLLNSGQIDNLLNAYEKGGRMFLRADQTFRE